MTVTAILSECQRRGIRLRVAGGVIKYRPIDAVDDELRAAMVARKAELLAELRRREESRVGPWQPPGAVAAPRQCIRCGSGLGSSASDERTCETCRYYFQAIMPARPQ